MIPTYKIYVCNNGQFGIYPVYKNDVAINRQPVIVVNQYGKAVELLNRLNDK